MERSDFVRLNRAAKNIEADACEAYFTTKEKYGSDVAGALLIMYLRRSLANEADLYPPPESVDQQVIEILKEFHILKEE